LGLLEGGALDGRFGGGDVLGGHFVDDGFEKVVRKKTEKSFFLGEPKTQ
jgi:hypothetical protein